MFKPLAVFSIVVGLAFCQSATDNTRCPVTHHQPLSVRHVERSTYELELFLHPVIVDTISIDTTNCDADREIIESNMTVSFVDAADVTMEERVYDTDLFGTWGTDESIELVLDPVIYTQHLTLTTWQPLKCSTVRVLGCYTSDMCASGTCAHSGVCVGNKQCACSMGYMGADCSMSVTELKVDDFAFVSAPQNLGVLFTRDAAFDVTGNVVFGIHDEVPLIGKRGYHHHTGHGNTANFQGHGGSCTHSSSHNGGYTHSTHNTYGHQSSHSSSSCLNNHQTGYTHTATFSYGHDHNHQETNYIYTTHGCNHNQHGSSLSYSNNELHMHVHTEQHDHYHVTAPLTVPPGQPCHLTSSFSTSNGASIYVNGNLVGSQCKPTSTTPTATPTVTTPPPPQSLCFGKCGAGTTGGNNNITISNIAVAGSNVQILARNMLLGLLGQGMINIALNINQQSTTTTSASTKATPVLAGSTLAQSTIVQQTSSILPPVTATSMNPVTATSAGTTQAGTNLGPVCYFCIDAHTNAGCYNVTQCKAEEECLVFHDPNKGYTHRCISKQDCLKGISQPLTHCWQCCSQNLCNDKCGSTTGSTSCQDDPQCGLLLTQLGPYYDICLDPAFSSTICARTCNKCP